MQTTILDCSSWKLHVRFAMNWDAFSTFCIILRDRIHSAWFRKHRLTGSRRINLRQPGRGVALGLRIPPMPDAAGGGGGGCSRPPLPTSRLFQLTPPALLLFPPQNSAGQYRRRGWPTCHLPHCPFPVCGPAPRTAAAFAGWRAAALTIC